MTTKAKLLRAAAVTFADRGYRAATVREICRRARVNLAAVNYHFGGKQGLYREVFADLFKATARHDLLGTPPADLSRSGWQQFLRDWVRTMVASTTRPPPLEALKLRLFSREMIDPSENFPELYEVYMAPRIEVLKRGFAAVLPGRPSPQTLLIHIYAVLGQGLFYCQHRPLVAATKPRLKFAPGVVAQIAEVIIGNALRGRTK